VAKETVGCRVPREWKDELIARAKSEGLTTGDIIQRLIADYLDKESGDRLSRVERRVKALERRLQRLGDTLP